MWLFGVIIIVGISLLESVTDVTTTSRGEVAPALRFGEDQPIKVMLVAIDWRSNRLENLALIAIGVAYWIALAAGYG